MKKRKIDAKFDEIVKFLDTPVKRYLSGMCVRLAFATAEHLEPERVRGLGFVYGGGRGS